MQTPSQHRLMKQVEVTRVEAALRAAEQRTSAELRVSVAPWFWGDVERAAERAFARLGMRATRQRNGVLFFLVPSRRRLVVLGDEAAHAQVGAAFWESVVALVTGRFHEGDFTGGLVQGIEAVAARLAEPFPYQPAEDVNELPDTVDLGPR